MRENPVKRKLAESGVALGTMVFEFATTGIARLAAAAGAEFVVFDQEHTGATLETVRMFTATARACDLVPLVRVPAAEYHLLAGALDVGPMGVMVPMVESGSSAVFWAWSRPCERAEIAITSPTPSASPSTVRIVRARLRSSSLRR